MNREAVETLTERLVLPILARMGLELVHIEFVKESGARFLRVYIDKPGGVGIEECSKVSEALGRVLDQEDPIPDSYVLEVSSPGAERVLKTEREFSWAEGKIVRVETRTPLEGTTVFQGMLRSGGDPLVLETDMGTVEIPRSAVKIARRALVR